MKGGSQTGPFQYTTSFRIPSGHVEVAVRVCNRAAEPSLSGKRGVPASEIEQGAAEAVMTVQRMRVEIGVSVDGREWSSHISPEKLCGCERTGHSLSREMEAGKGPKESGKQISGSRNFEKQMPWTR